MALLIEEARKLTTNDLVAGLVEEIVDRDELFGLLPFERTVGKAYVYNREDIKNQSQVDFVAPNDTIDESAGKYTEVTTTLSVIAGDVDVDKFLQATMSNVNDQKVNQIILKAKALTMTFKNTLIVGDRNANPKAFDGLIELIRKAQGNTSAATGLGAGEELPLSTAAGQVSADPDLNRTIDAKGAAISYALLDELRDMVMNGNPDVIIMRSGTWRVVKSLIRQAGGTVVDSIMVDNFGRQLRSFDGVPVVINDYIPVYADNNTQGYSRKAGVKTTQIFAVRLNELDGFHGLYGGTDAGWQIEDIGTVQNKDATRTRLKWYAGAALKSTRSVARIINCTSV